MAVILELPFSWILPVDRGLFLKHDPRLMLFRTVQGPIVDSSFAVCCLKQGTKLYHSYQKNLKDCMIETVFITSSSDLEVKITSM